MDELAWVNDFIVSEAYQEAVLKAAQDLIRMHQASCGLEPPAPGTSCVIKVSVQDIIVDHFHKWYGGLKTFDARNLLADTIASDVVAQLVNLGYANSTKEMSGDNPNKLMRDIIVVKP